MKVTVRYFGKIQEVTDLSEEHWDIAESLTIDAFRAYLIDKYPALKNETYQLAVNQELLDLNKTILAMAEIAVLPPFSGG